MRFFEQFNDHGDSTCPICKTASQDKGRVILVPIPGTEHDNIAEAQQIHEDCAQLVVNTLCNALDDSYKKKR